MSKERRLRPITRRVLERVRKAKSETVFPEQRLFEMVSRLGVTSSLLYEVFPEGSARFLARLLPKNETVKEVIDIYDFREKHGFPPGYIPPGYQLPQKDQG